MSHRIVFTFDDRSHDALKELTERGGFSSMGEAVRESLRIAIGLQAQNEQGFTEIVARNPETSNERVLVVPDLCRKGDFRHGQRKREVYNSTAVSSARA
jgi:Arc/MetJ-type ribon-helix-helix transcriptional regulator